MKIRIVIIALALLIFGCKSIYKKRFRNNQAMSYIAVNEEKERIKDSLAFSGIDTIIIYKVGFSRNNYDCYIFWQKDKIPFVYRVTNYSHYQINKMYFPYEFIFKNYNVLKNEELNKREYFVDYGTYDEVEIFTKLESVQYRIDNWNLSLNEDKIKKIIVDKFKAILWQYSTEWSGLSYKYYPKGFDRSKKKWQDWEEDMRREGVIK